jgi:hypothetical protein
MGVGKLKGDRLFEGIDRFTDKWFRKSTNYVMVVVVWIRGAQLAILTTILLVFFSELKLDVKTY